MTIHGMGFSTDFTLAESVTVSAGNIPMAIESVENSKIIASTGAHFNRHMLKIGGSGIVDMNGKDASDLTVEVGQEVHWSWNINIPGSVPVVTIQQVWAIQDFL